MSWLRFKVKLRRFFYPRPMVQAPSIVFARNCESDIKARSRELRRLMKRARQI